MKSRSLFSTRSSNRENRGDRTPRSNDVPHFEYGERIKRSTGVYVEGCDEIDTLAQKTGELVSLGAPEGERVVVIYTRRGEKVAQDSVPETNVPMRSSAMGKSILAHLPERRVDEITDGGASDRATGGDLADELERDGVAVTDDRSNTEALYVAPPARGKSRVESRHVEVDARSVAAPVLREGTPVGAVSVTGPTKRIDGQYLTDIRRQVSNTANLIETKLKYQ